MDRSDLWGKIHNSLLNERIVTRRYELLFKVYYLKAVQTMEMAGYIQYYYHRNQLRDVIKLKHVSQQLPSGRQMITLPPNETVLLVRAKDILSKLISTEPSWSQRHSHSSPQLPTGKLPAQTDWKATGVKGIHTLQRPDVTVQSNQSNCN